MSISGIFMLTDVGALQLWLLSRVLLISEGHRQCRDELNVCYEFFSSEMSHRNAHAVCRNRSGNLAAILDNNTQRYISSRVRSDYWIGGKLVVMDQLTWVDGTTYSGQWQMCQCIIVST